MKFDRGMIKWQPFDSVISSKSLLNTLVHEKEKIAKPVLSLDEECIIEEYIIEAFYSQEDVTLQYYWNGYLQVLTGKIKKIDRISKIIYLNSQRLFFKQIVAILT